MLDDEKLTQPLGGVQLLSYTLGELDSDAQTSLEKRIEAEPALKDELAEIREHMRLHQAVRKVAPRRGSFERLRHRMQKEGAFQGAIPGVHAMLRRSFMLAFGIGVIAVLLLIAFGVSRGKAATPDVIGQIVYTNPALKVGERRAEVERDYLSLWKEGDQPYDTGAYDAYIWLPTGVENTYSTIELTSNSQFKFTATRRMVLTRGSARNVEIQAGGMGEGPFVVVTPHCTIEMEQGSMSINITRDDVQTQISVIEGNARVFGIESNRSFPVPTGYCTSVERGKLPNPARPVLKLMLERTAGSSSVIQATLVNDGFTAAKVRRARSADPVYLLHAAHVADHAPESGVVENVNLQPQKAVPLPELDPDAHSGDMWLDPDQYYRFTFDISPLLISTPPVEHWLRLEYRGDLYGPPGQARVRVESDNLKLDLRKR